ncbi:hypothetical protein JJB11_09865 [Ramlibacter ginsenosidimutans]|uniref:Lipoprotein n=1 Tax=Ramlibacter ginsenosidimutans TaxID=502333 RepID=A0A934TTC0_9BURK|nr:hypothetical protein [Ramlibacter ginsenosidimutans]MBK6006397.1 hypothetical protein [Ramlibacter ginsenosidimutans]
MRPTAICMLGLVAALAAGSACADQAWMTTGDDLLADMRGGFALPDGLMVSFGIVRTVLIDGQVVSQTALQIPDVRSITVDQARQLGQQLAGVAVVQNGTANTLQLPHPDAAPGFVIQNSENNRTLQAITEITASTNTLRTLQGMNLNRTLSDALKGALGR